MGRQRLWQVLVVSLVVIMVLSGCATVPATPQPSAGAEAVTITFWHHFSGPRGDEMAAIIAEWNAAHPEIQVVANVVPFAPTAEYAQKMTAAAASGQPPDVFLNPSGPWAVGLDLAIPLDEYMARDGISLDDYYPGAVQRVLWEGKAYGLPFNMDTRGLWWNKRLFREAGLDPEKPPTTWDELAEYSEKLLKKDANGNVEVMGFMPAYGEAYIYGFIIQNGGRVQSIETSHKPPELLFDSPEGQEALAFMKRLVDINGGPDQQNAFLSSFTGGANDPFFTEQVAMMITGPWRLPETRTYAPDLEYGIAPEPLGPRATGPATLVGGFEVSIPKLSSNYDAAWEFAKYLGTLDVQIRMARVAGNTPAHKVPDDHPYLQEDPDVAYFVRAGEWGISFPEAPWAFPLFFAVAMDAVQEVFANEKTVEQALADARVRVQSEIDLWYANNP